MDVCAAPCWSWAAAYFGDCVCTPRDKVGFVLGLISVACWALAEVPQIVENYLAQSSEGISEGLLWVWVLADVMDVIGCSISDTLPSMLLTAWLLLIVTVVLLVQHIYYTRFKAPPPKEGYEPLAVEEEVGDDGFDEGRDDVVVMVPRGKAQKHKVYGSLRYNSIVKLAPGDSMSLAGVGSRMMHGPWGGARHRTNSFHAKRAAAHGLPGRPQPQSVEASTGSWSAGTRAASAVVGSTLGTFCLASLVILATATLRAHGYGQKGSLLSTLAAPGEEERFLGLTKAVWGQIVGWIMALMFFCGRVPQVVKNYQRKSCAGLSLDMFFIVLMAAVTYCASIAVRVTSWEDLKPKLPFFVDSALGGLLDLVILVQFMMYRDADDDDEDDSVNGPQQNSAASLGSEGKGTGAGGEGSYQDLDSLRQALLHDSSLVERDASYLSTATI